MIRLAEPVVALSGIGDPVRVRATGAAARSCFIACRLAHRRRQPADLFKTFIPELSSGVDLLATMRILTAALTRAPRLGPLIHRASCEVGAATASRIGLSAGVADALRHVQEWYDGKAATSAPAATTSRSRRASCSPHSPQHREVTHFLAYQPDGAALRACGVPIELLHSAAGLPFAPAVNTWLQANVGLDSSAIRAPRPVPRHRRRLRRRHPAAAAGAGERLLIS